MNVQSSDLLETLSLIFCGADVHCSTQMATWDSPLALAAAHSQSLQAELIGLNLNTGEWVGWHAPPWDLHWEEEAEEQVLRGCRSNLTMRFCFFCLSSLPPGQSELPRLDVGGASDPVHYSAPPCVSHNGFLFKTASVSRAVAERKAREGRTPRSSAP